MCSRKSHVVNAQYFLHEDNSQGRLLYRHMDRVLHWGCLSDSFWRDQLTKRCPACCDKPSIYSFGFWKFIKCPVFATEQWNKAPWDLLGSPIVMLIIPLTFLMMAPLLHGSSLPAKLDRHMETPQSSSQCQALYFMPWPEQRCKNIWDSKNFNP